MRTVISLIKLAKEDNEIKILTSLTRDAVKLIAKFIERKFLIIFSVITRIVCQKDRSFNDGINALLVVISNKENYVKCSVL